VPNRASLGLALAIVAVTGYGIYSALDWPLKAKLFPLVIGIPLFCLAAAEAIWSVSGKADAAEGSDFKLSEREPRDVVVRRTLLAAGWTIGFFFAIVLLGFLIAVPLLVFAYIRLQGRESWLFTIVFTAAVWGCFYGLFDMLLHLPFPPGIIFSWFA
jgi:hypothetical protein